MVKSILKSILFYPYEKQKKIIEPFKCLFVAMNMYLTRCYFKIKMDKESRISELMKKILGILCER